MRAPSEIVGQVANELLLRPEQKERTVEMAVRHAEQSAAAKVLKQKTAQVVRGVGAEELASGIDCGANGFRQTCSDQQAAGKVRHRQRQAWRFVAVAHSSAGARELQAESSAVYESKEPNAATFLLQPTCRREGDLTPERIARDVDLARRLARVDLVNRAVDDALEIPDLGAGSVDVGIIEQFDRDSVGKSFAQVRQRGLVAADARQQENPRPFAPHRGGPEDRER